MKDVPSDLCFFLLAKSISAETRAKIALDALRKRKTAPQGMQDRLADFLREHVRGIPGFNRDPSKAPVNLLRPILPRLCLRPEFFRDILEIWTSVRQDLRDQVSHQLAARGVTLRPWKDVRRAPTADLDEPEIEDLKALREDDVDKEELLAMVCCLSGRFPRVRTDEEGTEEGEAATESTRLETATQPLPKPWSDWINQLAELPVNSEAWGAWENFSLRVTALVKQKKKEKAAELAVEPALKQLQQDWPQIGIGQVVNPTDWRIEDFVAEAGEDIVHKLTELRDLLWESSRLEPTLPQSPEERKKKRQRLNELDTRVDELLTTTSALRKLGHASPHRGSESEDARATVEEPSIAVGQTEPHRGGAPAAPDADLLRTRVADDHPQSIDSTNSSFTPALPPSEPADDSPALAQGREGQVGPVTPISGPLLIGADEPIGIEVSEGEDRSDSDESPAALTQAGPAESSEHVEALQAEKEGATDLEPSIAEPGLSTARDAARDLLQQDADEHWDALLWALVGEDRLPSAIWLARTRAALGRTVPIPPALLEAVLGGRLIGGQNDELAEDIRALGSGLECISRPECVLALAAALPASLGLSQRVLHEWLVAPKNLPAVRACLRSIEELLNHVPGLNHEMLVRAGACERSRDRAKQAADRAKRWLDSAAQRSTSFAPAVRTWKTMLSPGQPLFDALHIVAQNRSQDVETVRGFLDEAASSARLRKLIASGEKAALDKKAKPISGNALDWLRGGIQDSIPLAQSWCDAVAEVKSNPQASHLQKHLSAFRCSFAAQLPQAEKEITELSADNRDASECAAFACLTASLRQLGVWVGVSDSGEPEGPLADTSAPMSVGSVEAALRRELLLYPGLERDSQGTPDPAGLMREIRDSCLSERSPQQLFEAWLGQEDYESIQELAADGAEFEPRWKERYAHALRNSRSRLKSAVATLRGKVEQALVDGLLSDDDRARWESDLVEIESRDPVRLKPVHKSLQELQNQLQILRDQKAQALRAEWEATRPEVLLTVADEQLREVDRGIEAELTRGGFRVVEEWIAEIGKSPEAALSFGARSSTQPYEQDFLESFRRAIPLLEESGRNLATLIDSLDVPEAKDALTAWCQLRSNRAVSRERNVGHILAILRFLGFKPGVRAHSTPVTCNHPDWLALSIPVTSSEADARPFYQFGSGLNKLHVVCVWNHEQYYPDSESIVKKLYDDRLERDGALVLYLDHLPTQHRRLMPDQSRGDWQLAVGILDELLLLFLTSIRTNRLRAFLQTSLAYASPNPYAGFGPVPPEMFFGRRSMLAELQRPTGRCLVYGGRQLGKSALLAHVRHQFHDPDQAQYALIRDMKTIFQPQAGRDTAHLWRALLEEFQRLGLLNEKLSTARPEEIRKHILSAMDERSDRRVIVMLDEADEFLDADAQQQFETVIGLRELMNATKNRLRFVFAGLQSVGRFAHIPNQPFVQFGPPLCVGPLEPADARDLVVQPLGAAGVRFAEPNDALLVLSYTNYHPALIQTFCEELLKAVKSRNISELPPHEIHRADIDSVYRQDQVRKNLADRFDRTLRLDQRYQAIAWAMIFDQMQRNGHYSRPYTGEQLIQLAAAYWPAGFADLTLDERASKLTEMCGLGVLSRWHDGKYRLRSPNLVRLMGTPEDISSRLEDLMEAPAPKRFEPDSYHVVLDPLRSQYSPWTVSQIRQLSQSTFGVSLLFISNATGLEQAPQRLFELAGPGAYVLEIPRTLTGPDALAAWLAERNPELLKQERTLLCHRLTVSEDLAEQVEVGIRFCQQHRAQKRTLRLVFLLDPGATRSWLTLPSERRNDLEALADTIQQSRRWDRIGIRQRLSELDYLDQPEICDRVLQATGGWQMLLDELFRRIGNKDDARPGCEQLQVELNSSESPLRRRFVDSFGLDSYPAAARVANFLRLEGPVDTELLIPDYVGGDPPLTAADIASASLYLKWLDAQVAAKTGLCLEPALSNALSFGA
jgi:hypothetical protein